MFAANVRCLGECPGTTPNVMTSVQTGLRRRRKPIDMLLRGRTNFWQSISRTYVRGDKAVSDRLLGVSFPSRVPYISRLRPQSEVASFEVKDLKIQIMDCYAELYRADGIVHYKSLINNMGRNYHNSILYKRTNGTWQIVEWHSVRAAG